MFELELLEQINKYNKTEDSYEQEKNKESITNLISQNNEEYKKFISSQDLNQEVKTLLEECENRVLAKEQQKSQENNTESSNDFETIKNYYKQWLDQYTQNNQVPNEKCEQIVLEIINFYVINRFSILKRVLEIKDTDDFENFKNMINNYLRKYFAEKVESYYNSQAFEELGFFARKKKQKQILILLNQIGEYKFDQQKIEETLK